MISEKRNKARKAKMEKLDRAALLKACDRLGKFANRYQKIRNGPRGHTLLEVRREGQVGMLLNDLHRELSCKTSQMLNARKKR